MTIRLFAALGVPDDVADLLTPLQRGVAGASWRPRENFHITLQFFGDLSEPQAQDLDEQLSQIEEAPFELQLQAAGSFGGREPHALWIGVKPSPAASQLSKECRNAARRLGVKLDKRPFRPHVTLAYCRGATDEDAAAFESRLASFQSHAFYADKFSLYSSRPGKGARHYVEEAVYPLG